MFIFGLFGSLTSNNTIAVLIVVSLFSSVHLRALCASGPHLLLQLVLSDHSEVEASCQSQWQHHPLPSHLFKAGRGQ